MGSSMTHQVFKSILYIKRMDPNVCAIANSKKENMYFNCLSSNKDHLTLLY